MLQLLLLSGDGTHCTNEKNAKRYFLIKRAFDVFSARCVR